MRRAGLRVQECYRALEKSGTNVVAEVLRGQGQFYEWDHYPAGDVFDPDTHAQYYYHTHPLERDSGAATAEHGHFHAFLRPGGFPKGIRPAPTPDHATATSEAARLSHLIAISMDRSGYPYRFFTTNRWVTGETFYDAASVSRMVRRFRVDQALPSPCINVWITGMLELFGPLIDAMLIARDRRLGAIARRYKPENIFEFRDAEIISVADISIEKTLGDIEKALGR
ncbi:MAG: hypothetical protein O2944_00700 [Proteobacteria bacterium]|nr:hypothetical protein [Pseudomonadota bacterium]